MPTRSEQSRGIWSTRWWSPRPARAAFSPRRNMSSTGFGTQFTSPGSRIDRQQVEPGPLCRISEVSHLEEGTMSQVATLEHLRDRRVGEIAANLPGATGVFRRFGIDFCCHGNAPLDEAAQTRGVDPETIEAALSALDISQPSELDRKSTRLNSSH